MRVIPALPTATGRRRGQVGRRRPKGWPGRRALQGLQGRRGEAPLVSLTAYGAFVSPPWQSSYGPTPGVLAYNLSFLGRIDSGSREEYDGLPVRVSVWRGRLRRAGWGMADQGFSSLTNFALGVLVARSVSPQAFGAFALVFTIYTLLLGFCRALATEPLLVRFTAAPDRWPSGVSSAAGMAALIGVFAGSGCLIVGSIFGGFIGYGLIGLGLTLPGLLVQDSWRYAFFAEGRADKAFVNDVVWAIV